MVSRKDKKGQLREKYKKIRDAIPKTARKKAAKKIATKLFHLKEFIEAKNIALYSAIGSEVNTLPVFKKAKQMEKKVFYPRIVSKTKELIFYHVPDLKKQMFPGPYGILQPSTSLKKTGQNQLELIVVPGIAFDKKGYRIGHGKGYYDRFLKQNPKIFSVGLCYHKTLVSSLPRQFHDRAVSCVITEKGIHSVNYPHTKTFGVGR